MSDKSLMQIHRPGQSIWPAEENHITSDKANLSAMLHPYFYLCDAMSTQDGLYLKMTMYSFLSAWKVTLNVHFTHHT